MKKRYGFTLAEVMITVGIVGFIAVISMSIMKNGMPNQEMILVKKAYHNISRIVGELINDEDFYPERDEPEDNGFANVSIKDLLGGEQEATFHGYSFSGDSKFCGLFASKLNINQSGDPNSLCQARVSLDDGGNFTTADGMAWSMPVGSFKGDNHSEDIYIDVNGPDKGNNCTCDTVGGNGMTLCASGVAPDRFVFRIHQMGGITLPARVTQLYTSSTRTSKSYQDLMREDKNKQSATPVTPEDPEEPENPVTE